MQKERKGKWKIPVLIVCFAAVFVCGWVVSGIVKPRQELTWHIPNPKHEYLVGSAVYQLSAESDALIRQGYALVKSRVAELVEKCQDPSEPAWQLVTGSAGENRMYHDGKRVAIICDIDDTLVNGVNYTADILGNDGDYNNAAFARFLMSDGCTALPGAVDCMNYCKESGVEIYYVTNRYDQGYKVGQSDSQGSYEAYKKEHGEGSYLSKNGEIIGTTVYELYGKSIYDISLASMQKLGFPVDDSHLIINDSKLNGPSKEAARKAIREGCRDYSNGQRDGENSLHTRLTFSCEPHEVVMLLGDQITDFTDDVENGATPVERRLLAEAAAEKFGTEWIVFPNAVYGRAIDPGMADPVTLFRTYAYTQTD